MEEAKPLKEVQFEPFDPRDPREPKVNIPDNIDATNPLELLDLFIPSEIYIQLLQKTLIYTLLLMMHVQHQLLQTSDTSG